jgi:hypothetical protein
MNIDRLSQKKKKHRVLWTIQNKKAYKSAGWKIYQDNVLEKQIYKYPLVLILGFDVFLHTYLLYRLYSFFFWACPVSGCLQLIKKIQAYHLLYSKKNNRFFSSKKYSCWISFNFLMYKWYWSYRNNIIILIPAHIDPPLQWSTLHCIHCCRQNNNNVSLSNPIADNIPMLIFSLN